MDEKLLMKAMNWKLDVMHQLLGALPKSLSDSAREVELTIIKGIHASTEEYLSKLGSEENAGGLQSVTID